MLRVALAGLVLSKILTLKQAEKIDKKMGNRPIPETVSGVIDQILKARDGVFKNDKFKN